MRGSRRSRGRVQCARADSFRPLSTQARWVAGGVRVRGQSIEKPTGLVSFKQDFHTPSPCEVTMSGVSTRRKIGLTDCCGNLYPPFSLRLEAGYILAELYLLRLRYLKDSIFGSKVILRELRKEDAEFLFDGTTRQK